MAELSYRRHRFPPVVIQHAVWLYLRFTLSYRDVEDLLAERGLDISYETVRSWVLKFGPVIARRLRRRRPRPSNRWHLDEMVVRIAGERMYLWRADDHEGEVLDMLVQRRRDARAALRLMRKILKKVEEVEQEKDESRGIARIRGRLDHAERGLPIWGNAAKLAIEIRLLCWQTRQGRGYGRILVRPVQARARQQLDTASVQAGVHAISVVLDLMQPFRALRSRVYQFAKLWLDPLWQTARTGGYRCSHGRRRRQALAHLRDRSRSLFEMLDLGDMLCSVREL
jgi:hypothetical protein